MKALLVFFYITVCILLILAVLLQNNKGAQMSAGLSSGGGVSKSFFGSAGSKGFLYTSTKWLVALFFLLALAQTRLDLKEHQRVEQSSLMLPVEHTRVDDQSPE